MLNDKVSVFLLWPRVNELLAEEWRGAKELRKTRWDGEDTSRLQFPTGCRLQCITVKTLIYEQKLVHTWSLAKIVLCWLRHCLPFWRKSWHRPPRLCYLCTHIISTQLYLHFRLRKLLGRFVLCVRLCEVAFTYVVQFLWPGSRTKMMHCCLFSCGLFCVHTLFTNEPRAESMKSYEPMEWTVLASDNK